MRQLRVLENVVDQRIAATFKPFIDDLRIIIPYVKARKEADDRRAEFWHWLKEQAEQVASQNVKIAINTGLWLVMLVIILGVTGVWRKFWPW